MLRYEKAGGGQITLTKLFSAFPGFRLFHDVKNTLRSLIWAPARMGWKDTGQAASGSLRKTEEGLTRARVTTLDTSGGLESCREAEAGIGTGK